MDGFYVAKLVKIEKGKRKAETEEEKEQAEWATVILLLAMHIILTNNGKKAHSKRDRAQASSSRQEEGTPPQIPSASCASWALVLSTGLADHLKIFEAGDRF